MQAPDEHKEYINPNKRKIDEDDDDDVVFEQIKKSNSPSAQVAIKKCPYTPEYLTNKAHAIIARWGKSMTKDLSVALSMMRGYVRDGSMPTEVKHLLEASIPGLDWSKQKAGRKAGVQVVEASARQPIKAVRKFKANVLVDLTDTKMSEYDKRAAQHSEHKMLQNMRFSMQALKSCLKSKGNVLYLDDRFQKTTLFLLSMGFEPYQLHCVNMNFADYEILRRDKNCKAFHCTMEEFLLRNLGGIKFSAVWFDYCASWEGNKAAKMFIQNDIELLFGGGFMTKKSTFAVTVSRHGAARPDKPDFDTEKFDFFSRQVDEFMTEMASHTGFSAKITDAMSYGKGKEGNTRDTTQSSGMLFHLYTMH
jgi:hypothetical protein